MLDFIAHLPQTGQLGLILVLVLVVTGIVKLLKQPLIIGYLIAGVVIGSFGIVQHDAGDHSSFFAFFSQLGISLLLFLVGLGLNPTTIKEHGKIALSVGLIQVGICVLLGFVLDRMLGFDTVTSILLAIGLSFSSTIVIVKLLNDAQETDTVYGKISIGILIVQDIVAMLLLMTIALFANDSSSGSSMLIMLLEGLCLVGFVIAISKWIMPRILPRMMDAHELTLLIGIGWCLVLGTAFQYGGFSYEIGCLLAGMSFAVSPWRRAMMEKLQPLRDFFIIIFFVHLGMQLNIAEALQYTRAIVMMSFFVLCIKPLITYRALKQFRYNEKSAFKASLTLGQMSEFSLILIGLGVSYGFIENTALLSMMMMVALISIFINSLLYSQRDKLFLRWKKGIQEDNASNLSGTGTVTSGVVVIGYGKFGKRIAQVMRGKGKEVTIIESHPHMYQAAVQDGFETIFADASNEDSLRELCGNTTQMVISSIREFDDDWIIAHTLKKINPQIVVVVLTLQQEYALELYDAGADYVILPYHISAHHMGEMLETIAFDMEKLLEQKTKSRELLSSIIS